MLQQFALFLRSLVTGLRLSRVGGLLAATSLLFLAACGGGSSGSVFVTINPASTSVVVGNTVQFTAAVGNSSNQTVTWQVNGTAGGDATHGTISASGLYVAPAAIPNPATVTVTAIAQADTNRSASASVKILATSNFSKATLNGSYAFSYSGQNASGFVAAAGSFSADGSGNITNGLEDINSGNGIFNPTFTGTYDIQADGRGTVTMNLANPSQTVVFQIAMANSQHGLFIRFDSGVATASGAIDKQTTSAFTNATFNGPLVANLLGIGSSNAPLVQAGTLPFNGAGTISNGVMDTNESGAVLQNLATTGTFNIGGNGRGTMMLSGFGTQQFAVYVVDSNSLKVVEIDSSLPAVVGDLTRGAASPATAFLNGGYAFTISGASTNGPLGVGGVLTGDGSGVFVNGSGTLDINDAGGFTSGLTLNSGSYNIGANGRGQLSLNLSDGTLLQYAIYPTSSGNVVLLDLLGTTVSSGVAYKQSGTPFTSSVLEGGFALNWAGAVFDNNTLQFVEEDISGQLTGDVTNAFSGSLDINVNAVTTSTATTGGSASVNSNGRGTLTVQTPNATFNHQIYVVDSNTILILDLDGVRVLTGVLKKQS